MDIEALKYPIGPYTPAANPDTTILESWIKNIENFPSQLEDLTKDVSVAQLNWKYRPNGWTVKQVIHHCTDSHINSLVRFKLALTEDMPTIKPYFEDRWAELPDDLDDDISGSMALLKGLHKKWATLLKSLTREQLAREFIHPEHENPLKLIQTIGIYSWHCQHHLAHVKNGLASNGIYN
ncbi:YfiT family bacillithiol transferase [Mangrovimonas sp. TPBH4]|uniref:YfiT family bacillithiol transferase n=1 Tax=Mangrovimonas sp. TPBH4 TaxID=1645914 RepID=UPI0006B48EDA|nr:putative metal-dependent hydrolase [Mangrovimonas sp. TPBH4]